MAEDISYYLQHGPGAFYFLGSGNREKNIYAPLHSLAMILMSRQLLSVRR